MPIARDSRRARQSCAGSSIHAFISGQTGPGYGRAARRPATALRRTPGVLPAIARNPAPSRMRTCFIRTSIRPLCCRRDSSLLTVSSERLI